MKILISIVMFFLFCSAVQGADTIKLLESKEEMYEQLLESIPIGSSVKTAVELIENNSFSCHWSDKKLYTGDRVSRFVNCFHAANPAKPTEKYWQIIIFHSNDLVELIEVKFKSATKKTGTLYTIKNNAKTRYTVRDKGTITFYNNKQFVLSEFLFSLKKYLEEYENIQLHFKVEDIPDAKVDDYSNITLSKLLEDIDRKNQIKVKKNRGSIEIIRDW